MVYIYRMTIGHGIRVAILLLVPLLGNAQSGALDPSFGVDGMVLVPCTMGLQTIDHMELLPDGRITAVATANHPTNPSRGVWVRLLPNGDLDSTLAGTGVVFDPPGPMIKGHL
jgi:hypothetical protein